MEKLTAYIRKHLPETVFLYIFTAAVFGVWAAHDVVTFDAEGLYRITEADSLYIQWLQLGRWSLVFSKYMMDTEIINPYFSLMMFFLCFPLSVLLWGYLFCRWRGYEKKYDLYIYGAVYLSHPIWALQFSYRNQLESISLFMVLVPIALFFVTEWMEEEENRRFHFYVSFLLLVLVFGSYQSFLFVYGAGILMYLWYHGHEEKKVFREKVKRLAVITVLPFIVSEAVGLIIEYVFVPKDELGYASGQFMWGSQTLGESILKIAKYIYHSAFGDAYTYSWLFGAEVILVILLILWKRKEMNIRKLLVFAGLCIVPFALEILTAGDIVARSQFGFVHVLAFFAMVLYDELPALSYRSVKILTAGLLAYALILQTGDTTRLLYTDIKVMESDYQKLTQIYYKALELGADEADYIAFIGGRANLEDSSMLEYEVVGFSYLEYPAFYESKKTAMAMYAMGFNVEPATDEMIEYAEEVAEEMDSWPSGEDWIRVVDDLIIVKLG